MLAVLLAAAASDTDFPACPGTITADVLTRCALTGHLALNGTSGTSTIYVHNGRSDSANVSLPDGLSYSIPSGEGLQVVLSTVHSHAGVHCRDCLLTIWHTPSLPYVNASFVSDAAGAVFNGTSVTLPTDYVAYFDFGNNARFRVYSLVHRRERPLAVFQQGDDHTIAVTDDVETRVNRDINVTGPGIFRLASSQFLVTTFRFVVGSTVRIPSDFSNRPAVGKFAVWDGAIKHASPEHDPFIRPAAEHQAWGVLAWVMVGLTVAMVVASGVAIVWLGGAQCRDSCTKGKAEPPAEGKAAPPTA